MALEVIGAGLGRTGTYSLNLALEALGLGPCHHMADVNASAEQRSIWRATARGLLPDWDVVYAGYRSAVDWPTAHFWRELAAYYPSAKFILTLRDPRGWYASVRETIAHGMGPGNDPEAFSVAVIGQQIFGGRYDDEAHAISVFNAHNEAVRSELPAERLLVYEVTESWEPLCSFLDLPVPEVPFPRANTTEEFRARARAR